MLRISVDLPQPLGPISAVIFPRGTSRLISWSAWVAPYHRLKSRIESGDVGPGHRGCRGDVAVGFHVGHSLHPLAGRRAHDQNCDPANRFLSRLRSWIADRLSRPINVSSSSVVVYTIGLPASLLRDWKPTSKMWKPRCMKLR